MFHVTIGGISTVQAWLTEWIMLSQRKITMSGDEPMVGVGFSFRLFWSQKV